MSFPCANFKIKNYVNSVFYLEIQTPGHYIKVKQIANHIERMGRKATGLNFLLCTIVEQMTLTIGRFKKDQLLTTVKRKI